MDMCQEVLRMYVCVLVSVRMYMCLHVYLSARRWLRNRIIKDLRKFAGIPLVLIFLFPPKWITFYNNY